MTTREELQMEKYQNFNSGDKSRTNTTVWHIEGNHDVLKREGFSFPGTLMFFLATTILNFQNIGYVKMCKTPVLEILQELLGNLRQLHI